MIAAVKVMVRIRCRHQWKVRIRIERHRVCVYVCVCSQPSVLMRAQEGGLLVEIAMDQLKDNTGLICKRLHWNEKAIAAVYLDSCSFSTYLTKKQKGTRTKLEHTLASLQMTYL